MRISTKGKNAVEALVYMASSREQDVWPVKVVSSALQVSERYLEQIFFILRKAGILETVRGIKGGYYLARKPDEIKVGEILRAVEGEFIIVPCLTCGEACTCNIQEVCTTRGLWYKLAEVISGVVDHLTLKQLADKLPNKGGEEFENLY